MPDVWLVELGTGRGQESALLRLLSADERARHGRFQSAEERLRFLVGRAALRTILGAALHQEPPALAFTYTASGKPELAAGRGETPLHFNVAHAGELVVLAFSRAAPVGVDVEREREGFDWRPLAAQHFTPAEVDGWHALEPVEARRAFFRAWTRHEAALKAGGTGLGGTGPGSAPVTVVARELVLPPGYVGAVALAGGTKDALPGDAPGVRPARKFHPHEEFFREISACPDGQGDSVAASPDEVGPTAPTGSGRGRIFLTSGCEIFGLAPGGNDRSELSAEAAAFSNASIVARFNATVRRHPERIAVDDGDRALKYRQLDEVVNAAANGLRRAVPGELHRVVLFTGQGAGAVIATLAVLKAGAAYVPLDPALPVDALRGMMASAEPAIVVADAAHRAMAERLTGGPGGVVSLEALEGDPDRSDPGIAVAPDALAYLYYTSGSTGKPKGVCDSHRNVLHNIWRYTTCLHIDHRDRLTLLQTPHFSGAVSSLFCAVLNGATSLPYDVRRDGLAPLGAWMRTKGVTIFHAVPAIFREAIAEGEFPRLRCVRLEGDQATRRDLELFRRHGAPDAVLANGLGATECGLVRQWRITPQTPLPDGPVPIGTPVPDMDVVLLDDAGDEVRPGEVGQIAVRSRYLAVGYWRQPELTAVRFAIDPSDPARRTYFTGDLGRMLPGGLLVYLGRKDLQAKLNGQWVDTEAVERVLATAPGVRECAVTVHQPPDGEPRLAAYVVPAQPDGVVTALLRAHLAARLPGTPLPAAWRLLERLPLTATLKVDRKSLPEPEPDLGAGTGAAAAPRDDRERTLAAIWCEVLGRASVGVQDNFFDLGGDSLLAMKLVARIRAALGRVVPFQFVFEHATIAELAAALAAGGGAPVPAERDAPVPAAEAGGLSFAQQRLWFLDRFEGSSIEYHIADAVRVRGPLRRDALARALNAVVRRHEALRIRIMATPAGPRPEIAASVDEPVPCLDLAPDGTRPDAAAVTTALRRERDRPFDLTGGALFRVVLFRLGGDDHVLLRVWHHIVADGVSLTNFNCELAARYEACARGGTGSTCPLPAQYSDYVRAQLAWMAGGESAAQLAYWRRQLREAPVLELPTDRPRPPQPDFAGASCHFEVSGERVERLRAFNRAEKVTAFMSLLAVFQVLLARISGQADVVVGTPVNHRPGVEFEELIGLFVNPLVVRTDLSGEPGFRAVVQRVRRVMLEAFAHRDLPFEKLVEALNPPRDLGRQPLFQVVFAMQEAADAAPLQLPGVAVEAWRLPVETTHFDLELHFTPHRAGWTATLVYATKLFEPGTIERMAGHFLTLLDALLADVERPVWRAPILTAPEERIIRQTWNATAVDVPPGLRLHDLVRLQAEWTPGAVAVEGEDGVVRYGELEEDATRLAAHLQQLGARAEVCVGVCLERSAALVTALLGVLKSGAAYVPLDPRFPRSRLELILAEATAPLLVAQRSLASLFTGYGGRIVYLDEWRPDPAAGFDPGAAGPENAAYVLFTSGTTGCPKGVVVEHRSVVNLLWNHRRRSGLAASDVGLALATPTFDFSVLEIFPPLMVGARVVIAPDAVRIDGRALAGLIRDRGITVMNATPTTWRMLVASGWTGAPGLMAVSGGEVLPPALAGELLARTKALWNIYGPTETTVYSVFERVAQPERISIGRPFANTRAYVVDRNLQLLPAGVPGELVIAGAGVARGYLHQPVATAERFIVDPFGPTAGARAYRTGDRCRWRADGALEYLGRDDDQVKIRGVRIELGEIEAALRRHASVRAAAVAVRTGGDGEARLVGCIVPADPASAGDVAPVRDYLRQTLPSALVPAEWMTVPELPQTATGKVDRGALLRLMPGPRPSVPAGTGEASPLERELQALWQDLFPRVVVGREDNFFDLGGHSLLAARLATELERRFGRRVPVAMIFLAPTVAGLARALTRSEAASKSGLLLTLQPAGDGRPLYCVHGWGGDVHGFVALAREFAPDRPVLGLQSARRAGEDPPHRTVEVMAAAYADEIQAFQPCGPYHLLGHSAGGWVAFAVALELTRRGARVATLALLDTAPAFRLPWLLHLRVQIPFLLRRLAVHGRTWWRLSWPERWAYGRDRGGALRRHLTPRPGVPAGHEDPVVAAVARYRPEPYPGEVVVLTVEDSMPGLIPIWKRHARGGVTLCRVAGTHHSMLDAHHAPALAGVLKNVIRERDRDGSGNAVIP